MYDAYEKLRSFGSDGLSAFQLLLEHESPHVRKWVAAELLFSDDHSAKPVLESLATLPGLIGLGAQTTLRLHSAGQLNSPFPRDAA
jgi:hypothetical protein